MEDLEKRVNQLEVNYATDHQIILNIQEQVMNHIPTSIKELKNSLEEKLEDIKKSNSLYFDNRLNSHTRDVLDERYAGKYVETTIASLEKIAVNNKIKQGIFYWKYGIIWGILGAIGGTLIYVLLEKL